MKWFWFIFLFRLECVLTSQGLIEDLKFFLSDIPPAPELQVRLSLPQHLGPRDQLPPDRPRGGAARGPQTRYVTERERERERERE